MEAPAVSKFREYLRIKTVHFEPDYESAILFLKNYAEELELTYTCLPATEDMLDIVVMTWKGYQPSLPSIVLNSHTDVVPIYPEYWKYDAFSAFKDENGNIFGRGTQDMKCVGIQYLEAIRELKKKYKQLKRNIHLLFVPDEEIGGKKGMKAFMETDFFKDLNIGFVLDEGLANPANKYSVFYGERALWWLKIMCSGNPGHASRFIKNSTPEKLRKILNQILDYRDTEEQKMESGCLTLGDVTTVNLTTISGGVAQNMVPAEIEAVFDFRISPNTSLDKLEEKLKKWCSTAGEGVTYSFLQNDPFGKETVHDDSSCWWKAFKSACDDFGVEIQTEIFPAATDSCFLRQAGFPAIGFSPIRNTPILLHDHNEFLNEAVFLEGIQCYCKVIFNLSNV